MNKETEKLNNIRALFFEFLEDYKILNFDDPVEVSNFLERFEGFFTPEMIFHILEDLM
jgi:hypothetical protein